MENLESICIDCSKYEDCPKKSDNVQNCDDFEEARYILAPKGVFMSVVADMGWTELLSKDGEIAWELYENRTKNELVLDADVFKNVVSDMGWCDENTKQADIAFELFVGRMKNLGYLGENKEEKEC